jgi:hypothetical protein
VSSFMSIDANVVLDDEAYKPSRLNPVIFQKKNPRDDTRVGAFHAGAERSTFPSVFPEIDESYSRRGIVYNPQGDVI